MRRCFTGDACSKRADPFNFVRALLARYGEVTNEVSGAKRSLAILFSFRGINNAYYRNRKELTEMKKFYYDVTIHYGLVGNVCYDTREESGFETLTEAVQWSIDQGWDAPIKLIENSSSSDYVGHFAVGCVERGDEEDYLLIRRMRRSA